MILVIGGRSRTGRELIRLLREAGAPLRILTRAAENPGDPQAVPRDLARHPGRGDGRSGEGVLAVLGRARRAGLGPRRVLGSHGHRGRVLVMPRAVIAPGASGWRFSLWPSGLPWRGRGRLPRRAVRGRPRSCR